MKLAYVLGKWEDPVTRRRMLAHNLRGEMTEPVVMTRRQRQRSIHIESSNASSGSASQEETVALGNLLISADGAGLSSVWSRNIFLAMMCSAARNDEVDLLEQLLHIVGHLEVLNERFLGLCFFHSCLIYFIMD